MTRHYIVRLPTQGEETRMALEAAERTEKRRTIRNGVIAGFLAMATIAAILAAGTSPVKGVGGDAAIRAGLLNCLMADEARALHIQAPDVTWACQLFVLQHRTR